MAGRPKQVITKKMKEACYELAKKGLNEALIAKGVGITYPTFQKYKSEFIEYLKKGREEGDDINTQDVENSMLKAAKGYMVTERHIEKENGKVVKAKIVNKYYPPNATLAIYWTVNRKPERWQSVNKHEIEAAGNTDDRLKEIADAIEKSDGTANTISQ